MKKRFQASLSALEDMRHFLRGAVACALNAHDLYRFVVALDELTTNIIQHGYGLEKDACPANDWIDLSVCVDQSRVCVIVEDKGKPFDLKHAHPPGPDVLDAPLEKRKSGGMGLLLIFNGVDGVDYERDRDINRTILWKSRSLPQTP